ncbi:aldehyde dehydrogenase family protein [Microbacterium sp. Kw_RZR3]|uniref:aldehyde dehydrogenase family protein n=1 Tax=Microbacterium sp. Kw_RZR3 TaxID=3032903 RepID=UPI0023DA2259|nr:aldehyde dehydrogenase family protein [Microbacterium sp. Kw_RZR3]MDF2047631.1 aldehyde dehydrogenase family protein [Microbacterium sp. Kw_RZR3]
MTNSALLHPSSTDDIEPPRELRARNPRSGEIDYVVTPPTPAEVTALAASLREGQRPWRDLGLSGRIAALSAWADAIERDVARIARAEGTDTARVRVSSEVPYMVAAAVRDWCAKAPALIDAATLEGRSSVMSDVTYTTQFEPYGLLGIISPWNHPFLLSSTDAIPALLAGCAVLVKPSEVTPRFIEPVMSTIRSVPELASVFAYIPGAADVGQAVIDNVDALCFTGSVSTGRLIAAACASRFIPAFLELGGKDAAIVTATADVASAASAILKGSVHNTGQLCFSTERIYVDRTIYEPFVAELVRQSESLELSYPDPTHGHLGPFILERQAEIVDDHLRDAVVRGATILTGGTSVELGGGRYMRPTVLVGVDHSMRVMTEETFGPVMPVMPYESIDEAVELANDSEFGLSGAVISGSAEESDAVARRLDAGAISLQDTSLTIGIMRDVEKVAFKASGLGGSRMGPAGLLRFLRKKALILRTGPVVSMEALAEHNRPV